MSLYEDLPSVKGKSDATSTTTSGGAGATANEGTS